MTSTETCTGVYVDRPTLEELETTVHALHGIFWALNQLVSHHVADGLQTEMQIRVGVDELIPGGQIIANEIRERF